MTSQMNLLYLSDTGHILALFTRSAQPAQLEKAPDDFAGSGLHVRGLGDFTSSAFGTLSDFNNLDVVIPLNRLALSAADVDPIVMMAPRLSYIDSNKQIQPATITGQSAAVAPPTITITVTAAPSADLAILVLIDGPSLSAPHPISGKMPATQTTTIVNLPILSTGSYYALVFIETYSAIVQSFSI